MLPNSPKGPKYKSQGSEAHERDKKDEKCNVLVKYNCLFDFFFTFLPFWG